VFAGNVAKVPESTGKGKGQRDVRGRRSKTLGGTVKRIQKGKKAWGDGGGTERQMYIWDLKNVKGVSMGQLVESKIIRGEL